MKLAFCLFKYYPYGGLERDFMRVAQGALQLGHEVHVFTMAWEGHKPDGFNIHILPIKACSNHKKAYAFSQAFLDIKKHQHFDRVIGFNRLQGLDIYFASDLCFLQTAKEKHGAWYQFSSRYKNFKFLEQAVFSKQSKTQIIVLTKEVKESYQAFYNTHEERFTLVPAGIEKLNLSIETISKTRKNIKDQFKLTDKDTLILQVGSDFKRKGLDRSLKSIASLDEKLQKNLHFFIVGKGKAKPYQRLTEKLNIKANIQFLGTRNDVNELMQGADLLLHPAYHETAGMVIIEALTRGLPILVTQNCGYAYHVKEAQAGLVVNYPFKQEQLDEYLKQMLQSDKANWQQNALAYAKDTDLYSLVDKVLAKALA